MFRVYIKSSLIIFEGLVYSICIYVYMSASKCLGTLKSFPSYVSQLSGVIILFHSESKTQAGERMELPGAPQRVNSRIRNQIRGLQPSSPPCSYLSSQPAVGKTSSFVRTFDKPYWEPDHARLGDPGRNTTWILSSQAHGQGQC